MVVVDAVVVDGVDVVVADGVVDAVVVVVVVVVVVDGIHDVFDVVVACDVVVDVTTAAKKLVLLQCRHLPGNRQKIAFSL